MSNPSRENTKNHHNCLCGCGQIITTLATYRAGHDAAHVSNLLADAIQRGNVSQESLATYLRALPSDALRAKFQRAVDNWADRKAKKAAGGRSAAPRTEWVDSDTDDYRIGRWTYPVQVLMLRADAKPSFPGEESEYKEFRRNTKRDGSGEWVALEGGELVGR